jgi:hypothetical protein
MNTDRPPQPHIRMPSIDHLESLEEITEWLGTFRERLRLAREHDREHIAATLNELNKHYLSRRAELA